MTPHLKRRRAAREYSQRPGGALVAMAPRMGAEAYVASSYTHPDLRRWIPFAGSADADLLPELGAIRSRSRDLERNHGLAGGALQTTTDNVVGTGLRLVAAPDYRLLGRDKRWAKEWATQVEAWWRTWWHTPACDAAGCLTGDGITSLVYRSGWLNGEALALPLWLPDPRPHRGRFATRLQVIESDRLCNPDGRPDTQSMRGGVQIDRYGAPLGYWIKKFHPGDVLRIQDSFIDEWEFIPAMTPWGRPRVIHVHDKERAQQTRGKPSLAGVMRQFKVLGDFTNAELKAAVVNAMVALVTESSMGEEAVVELLSHDANALKNYLDGLSSRDRSAIGFTDGMIVPLNVGEKLSGFTPGRPSNAFEAFTTTLFRHIAAGLNIPYELLLKDFSKTNYSSARAALNEAWRFFRGRRNWLATYWATPVYGLWLEEAINVGLIEAPDFYENQAAYMRCRWIGPGRGWIDVLKEAQGSEKRMENMTSNLEIECAEQGLDWLEVLDQAELEAEEIAARPALAKRMAAKAARPPAAAPPQPEREEPSEPGGEDEDEEAAEAASSV